MQSSALTIPVLQQVAKATGLSVADITGATRTNRVAHARFIAVHLLRRSFPSWTLEDLARAVGGHDPGMARHALLRVPELAEMDRHFRAMLSDLERHPSAPSGLDPALVALLATAAEQLESVAKTIRTIIQP